MPGPAADQTIVRLERIGREFDGGRVAALRDVDLSLAAGECVALVGPSGSGKSSLVNMLCGVDTPSVGRVYWRGSPVSARSDWSRLRGTEIGVVFQDFNLLPTLTALENVELAELRIGKPAAERRQRAEKMLRDVGLADRQHHLPHALSGGERQRVAIARALVNAPALLLADEPTGSLDSANAALVAGLLFDLQRSMRVALLLVTHDEALASRCQRRVHLRDGRIVEHAAPGRLTLVGDTR
jgi:putative ABC transport system ATP-binding protein